MGMPNQKKLILIVFGALFLFFLVSGTAPGQEKEIEKIKKFIKKKRINAAYLMAGENMFAIGKLNDYLGSGDFPTVPKNYFTYGLGGHVIHNKFVLGLEIQRSFKKKQMTAKAFTTSLSAKYSILNIGYLFYWKKGLMMYPLVGVGLGELKLRVIENNIQSFEDIGSYQKGSDSRTRSILVNMGFALDYFLNFNRRKKGQNNLMMGVRLGFLVSAARFDWSVNHVHVPDGPPVGLTGPYVRVVIGLGGWVEKLIEKAI